MPRKRLPPRMFLGDGGYWHVSYFDEAKGRTLSRSLGEKDEEAARSKFGEWLVRHKPDSITPEQVTVAAVLEFYLNEHVEKEVVRKDAPRSLFRLHVGPFFGQMKEVTPKAVKLYVEQRRASGAADGSINQELRMLKAAYSFAAKMGFGGVKYVPLFQMPPSSPPKEDFLTAAQIETVLTHLEATREDGRISPLEAFFMIAYRAAPRRGAVLDLTWDRVNFRLGQIDFRSDEWKARPRKQQSKRRVIVPMSKRLRAFMEELYEQRDPDEPRVVPATAGQIQYRCEILSREVGFKITPHLLRRSFGSNAAMSGIAIPAIARIMGNTEAVAEARYVRFSPGYLQGSVEID